MATKYSSLTISAASAYAAIGGSNIIRRITSKVLSGIEPIDRGISADVSDKDTADLPELGEKLRNQEYTFRAGLHMLNNGSYGCIPRRIVKAQQKLMDEREHNPEEWYRFRRLDMFRDAARHVAEFVGAEPANLVLVDNTSTGINSVLRSYKFEPGDQILVTSHVYPAVLRTVELMTDLRPGVDIVSVDIPESTTAEDIIDSITNALDNNPRIKMAMLDHIAFHSAILMPIKKLIEVCHSRGVMTVIDGAHGPGQVQLDLEELGADFYCGNLYKWSFAPRGCGFMYVHPKHHSWIRSAVTSHYTFAEDLITRFHYVGTRENTAYYTAKEAIAFYKWLGGRDRIVAYNRNLKEWAADMLAAAWKTERVYLPEDLRAPSMCIVNLPQTPKLMSEYSRPFEGAKDLIHDIAKHNCAVNIMHGLEGQPLYFRVCAHVFNYKEEYFAVRDAVNNVLGVND